MLPTTPLAERMRPTSLDEYIGQDHIVGPNAPLRKALDSGIVPSMILWGPPGVGKTTLAQIIAKHLDRPFFTLSAISSGVKDVREIIQKAETGGMFQQKGTLLFIDEIHRFSKSQQDSLLGAVEKGVVTLIGATTENPSFEVISALLSRCQVYVLKEHNKAALECIVNRALEKDQYLLSKSIKIESPNLLYALSGGDSRKLLNLFELVVGSFKPSEKILINEEAIRSVATQNIAQYDKDGEQHYDIISAFIKSIRGSDPNAAIYWLARMVEGGEDPKFIARRLIISASEDIGLANPTALIMANNCFQAVSIIGWPESRILLSQCTIYLATSPKGNASYLAIDKALNLIKETGDLGVPLPLRNAPTRLMKELGYGKDYLYSHNYPSNFVQQEFMPEGLENTNFFDAGSNSKEKEIEKFINDRWGDKYREK
ncbi:MAG: replication-associated recombination protein A [Bacteroidetes bacterium]|nr:replication-associated recombination protein A [Bacteroidota bacterium]